MSGDGVFLPRVTRAWYVACESAELRAAPLSRTILGLPLVLFRDASGGAAALVDRCAHRNVPLSGGRVVAGRVECPYHGWAYDGTGRCVDVPGLAGDPPAGCVVDRHATRERDGFVWVYATPGVDPDTSPHVVPLPASRGATVLRRTVDMEGTLHAVLENVLDVPHTAFLHRGLFRGSGARRRLRVRVTRTPEGVRAEYLDEPRPEGLAARLLAPRGGVVRHVDSFTLPSIARVEYAIGDDASFEVTVLCTPVEEFRTRLHAVVRLRTPLPAILVRLVALPVVRRILGQDAAMLRLQSEAARRFGGERHHSTQIDVLGAQIARLLRRAETGGASDEEPDASWSREFTMEA
jgi:phenylpropionate dioxygenase-like ring-hydroxylating dioxygenase large terminal subunit